MKKKIIEQSTICLRFLSGLFKWQQLTVQVHGPSVGSQPIELYVYGVTSRKCAPFYFSAYHH